MPLPLLANRPESLLSIRQMPERYLVRGVNFVAVASDINSMATSLRQTGAPLSIKPPARTRALAPCVVLSS